MAAFYTDIKISKYIPPADRNPDGSGMATVSALAGTGAKFPVFPASLLTSLGIEPQEKTRFRRADGSIVTYQQGSALIKIGDAAGPCPVIFGPEGRFVLGKLALENLLLEIDDAGKSLVRKEYSLLVSVLPDYDDDDAAAAADAIRPAMGLSPALLEAE